MKFWLNRKSIHCHCPHSLNAVFLTFFFHRLLRKKSLAPAEQLIAILQEALTDHSFVVDYQRLYPVQDDMDILTQACPEL